MKTRLLLHHVSKDRNIETLQNLSSNFFSLDELVLVGRRKDEKLKSGKNEGEDEEEEQQEEPLYKRILFAMFPELEVILFK